MNTILTFFKNYKGRWLMAPAVFLLCALLPEYIAPVLACIAFVMTVHFKEKNGSFMFGGIGRCILLYIMWMIIGLFYSHSLVSGLTYICIWMFMLLGYLMMINCISSRRMLDTVLFAGTLSGGIAGGIGIVQILLYHYGSYISPSLKMMFNPFWHILDKAVARFALSGILPDFVVSYFQRKQFIAIAARASSTFTNPLFFAAFLVIMMPFAAYCLLYFRSRRKRALSFVCLILIVGGIASSYSRGPYLALGLTFFVLLFYGKKRTVKLLSLAAASLIAMMVFASSVFMRLLSLFSNNDISINTRSKIFDACLDMIKQKWLFGYGTGVNNIREMLHSVYGIKQPHAHNIFLEIILENGVIGLLFFIAILVVFAVMMFKLMRKGERERGFAITFLASIVAFCACGMTDCLFYGLKPTQYFLMILGLAQVAIKVYSVPDSTYNEDDVDIHESEKSVQAVAASGDSSNE